MEAIAKATAYLQGKGVASPRLDAEVLLGHILHWDRLRLYMEPRRPLTEEERAAYERLILQRGRRVPVAYLTGEKEFLSRPFFVNEDVLIPRPETELLVEAVMDLCRGHETMVDVGTGSGIIAISLKLALPASRVLAIDISPAALAVARRNAARHGAHVEFLQGDLLEPIDEPVEIIISNPPYIPRGDLGGLAPEVGYEPALALDGGADGLDYYKRLLEQARDKIRPGGYLALEIGWGQGEAILELARSPWRRGQIREDYQGIPRVLLLERGTDDAAD
jgi:release factor glutamine methyltransferase